VVQDQAGRGVEHLHALYRPDRYAFEIDLVRSGAAETKAWSPIMRRGGKNTAENVPDTARRTSTASTLHSKTKPAGLTPPR
jgi:GntR family transcriptional regulator